MKNSIYKELAVKAGFYLEKSGEIYSPIIEDEDISSYLEKFAELVRNHTAENCAELVGEFENNRTFQYAGVLLEIITE